MPKRPSSSDKMRRSKKPKSLEEEIMELYDEILNAAKQGNYTLMVTLKRQQAELKQQQAKIAYEKAKAAFESIKKPGIKKEDAKIAMDQAHAVYLALSGTYGFVSHAKIS